MMDPHGVPAILVPMTDELRLLVRLAAAIAAAPEDGMRAAVADAVAVRAEWVEEVVLQSYLFAGFPRALNAAREWRRVSGRPAPRDDVAEDYTRADGEWRGAGERTCETVYGASYAPLRRNIRRLHPALDAWMIVEGYGKVLSRPGLDLLRRELCIVAACLASEQDRQLHSHLHGALNAGADPAVVRATLDALGDLAAADAVHRAHLLFTRVLGSR